MGMFCFKFYCYLINILVPSNMEIAFAADNTVVKQNVAGPNIHLSI